jgi:hypothetical protein
MKMKREQQNQRRPFRICAGMLRKRVLSCWNASMLSGEGVAPSRERMLSHEEANDDGMRVSLESEQCVAHALMEWIMEYSADQGRPLK